MESRNRTDIENGTKFEIESGTGIRVKGATEIRTTSRSRIGIETDIENCDRYRECKTKRSPSAGGPVIRHSASRQLCAGPADSGALFASVE
ncbi:hypothetical protein EVAR_90329_1 [Eumeta japonica]|uniref:Uncharacterized protein n=1 Tax=Eumeta variegata TaxID=151549 RepID=A0A4C1YJC9_EUMVA|nr:hypothetical protein EVAR_90329_1 [Eumeta japonica]